MINDHKPDVLLLDLGCRMRDGLDLLKQIRSEHPALPVIV